jgi:hypothetical protein
VKGGNQMYRLTIIIFILLICISASAKLNLEKVNPDEPVDYTLNERLSFENSLIRLKQVDSALDSFRKLTDASKNTMSKEELNATGNTGWEIQNLGFENWTNAIEGTLYKQEYLIKKINYDFALKKFTLKEIDEKELLNAENELKQAEKNFQDWWDSFSIAD